MSSIQLINKNTNYTRFRTIRIDKETIQKIYGIISKWRAYINLELDNKLKEDNEYYDLKVKEFAYLIERLFINIDFCLEVPITNTIRLREFETHKYNNLIKDLKNLVSKFFKADDDFKSIVDDVVFSYINNEIDIVPIIDKAIELIEYNFNLYKLGDLINAKENILENLQYIFTDEEVNKIKNEYEQALDNFEINKIEDILKSCNQLITNHWQKFITKPEDIQKNIQNGLPFYFLGHSTNSTEFKPPFFTRFVSSSLLCKDLTDTHHAGFGFIIAPTNIVGAKSKDMYIDNAAYRPDEIALYSTIPLIDTPEKILKEALALKESNKKRKLNYKVYTETVTDGFTPIGIFCITDGSKTLNSNYNYAIKLQKGFPSLPFVEIDKTLCTNDNLENCSHLIDVIMEKLDNHKYYISTHRDLRFRLFWEKFMALKKQGNYTEEDILKIYKENEEYITMTNFKDLDKKGYDNKTLKYILLKNFYTNIEYIFKREIYNPKIYEDLYYYLKDLPTDFLNNIIPNLGDFIKIYAVIKVDSKMVFEINNLKIINFKNINQILINKLPNEKDKMQKNLQQEIKKQERLLQKYENVQKIMSDYNHATIIVNSKYLYTLASFDIDKIKRKLEFEEQRRDSLKEKNDTLQQQLKEKKQIETKYKRFYIFYYFKLKKLKQEIMKLEEEIKRKNLDIKDFDEKIDKLNIELSANYEYFKKQIGCDYDEYPDILNQSSELLKTINPNSFNLDSIKDNIEYIESLIAKYKSSLTNYVEIENQLKTK